MPAIYDCYALTLQGNTLWSCYYGDFPIVRVERGSVRHWRNDVAGAGALIDGAHILLAGGYGDHGGGLRCLFLKRSKPACWANCRFDTLSPDPRPGRNAAYPRESSWQQLTASAARAALGV